MQPLRFLRTFRPRFSPVISANIVQFVVGVPQKVQRRWLALVASGRTLGRFRRSCTTLVGCFQIRALPRAYLCATVITGPTASRLSRASAHVTPHSFMIDGEAVVVGPDGLSRFDSAAIPAGD